VLRHQKDRRFSPQILKAQLGTRGIYPMQPIQKWLRRSDYYRRSVNRPFVLAQRFRRTAVVVLLLGDEYESPPLGIEGGNTERGRRLFAFRRHAGA
jgi:hypothetical protein